MSGRCAIGGRRGRAELRRGAREGCVHDGVVHSRRRIVGLGGTRGIGWG